MRIDLTGKTAIVTGSTSGIGLATAASLAGSGARVIVTGLTQAELETALPRLQAAAPDGHFDGFVVDLSGADGVAALVAAHPSADILVNSLGIYGAKAFADATDADWERTFQVNVMSGVRMSRAYLPGMMARGWGRVVFVSSEASLAIPVDMIHYATSKAAQLAVSRGLAKVAAGTGVTVNAVLPGPTLTDGIRAFLTAEADKSGRSFDEVAASFVREARPSSLIQRLETPEEIANLITYLASPQASATTGAALRVDGGVVDTIA